MDFNRSKNLKSLINNIKKTKNYEIIHHDSFMRLLPMVISSHHNLLHNFYPFSLEEFFDENSLLPNTTDDDDTDDQNDFVLVKSFGFLFVVAFVSLVVIIFLALKLYKIRAKTIAQRRGNLLSRTIELSDDVETLRSRYQPS